MVQYLIFSKGINKCFIIINKWPRIHINFENELVLWITPYIFTKMLNTQKHCWSCLPLDFIAAEVYWYLQNQSRLHICIHGEWARWSFICPFPIHMNPLQPLKVQPLCCRTSSSFARRFERKTGLCYAAATSIGVNVYPAYEHIKLHFCFCASELHS